MAKPSPWPWIHAERAALVKDLEKLTAQQWATPSMCEGWTVQDMVGHMTAATHNTAPKFFAKLIGYAFKFNDMVAADVQKFAEGTPADTLARFEARKTSKKHPPGPVDTWLGETVVHAEDIRRPLGIKRKYPEEALVRLADMYRASNLIIGGKKRVAGLKLRATDADWSAGSGQEVSGPLLSIVLATAGRPAALADLSGPGLATLKGRS